ncbi:MAG: SRPBCC domain-containing protein [Acidimicrobiia bacterium]|jgi:uncharacterized protein YndB with AHSA1/START domain
MTRREEHFEIDIDATPAEVWEMLTTSEGIASWFGTRAQIDLRVDGERIVGWGDRTELSGRITELAPGRRLKLIYLADGEETGAEEWLVSTEGGVTRLTLICSMSDEGTDDWEGFFGDIRRGWRLFMTSMRFGLEEATTPDRVVDCVAIPAPGPREAIWEKLQAALDSAEMVGELKPALLIPPHSRLLVAPDRTLLLDIEGSGPGQVLYAQAATHDGPEEWRRQALEVARRALQAS